MHLNIWHLSDNFDTLLRFLLAYGNIEIDLLEEEIRRQGIAGMKSMGRWDSADC